MCVTMSSKTAQKKNDKNPGYSQGNALERLRNKDQTAQTIANSESHEKSWESHENRHQEPDKFTSCRLCICLIMWFLAAIVILIATKYEPNSMKKFKILVDDFCNFFMMF